MSPESQPAQTALPASALRTRFGLLLTGIYFLFVAAMYKFSEQSLHELALNEFGDYFAGVFGPVAILWLVLGFMQQGEELRYSAEALHLQAAELKASVEEQRELVSATKLQVEDERRREQHRLARDRAAAQPHFSVNVSRIPIGGGGTYRRATISNRGADVTDVWVTSRVSGGTHQDSEQSFLKRGDEMLSSIGVVEDARDELEYFTIRYRTVLGESWAQDFSYTGFLPENFPLYPRGPALMAAADPDTRATTGHSAQA